MSWIFQCDQCGKTAKEWCTDGWTEAAQIDLKLTFNLKRREIAATPEPPDALRMVEIPAGWGIYGSAFATPSGSDRTAQLKYRDVRHFCTHECLVKAFSALTQPDAPANANAPAAQEVKP